MGMLRIGVVVSLRFYLAQGSALLYNSTRICFILQHFLRFFDFWSLVPTVACVYICEYFFFFLTIFRFLESGAVAGARVCVCVCYAPRRWFLSESEEDRATLLRIMKRLDPEDTGGIDYVEWSKRMRLDNLAEITA